MDNRLKEIVDNFDSLKIGVDEPFRFHCTMCGKCCINREDILLTPRDIYCMAKELQISPEELFKRYCETYIGHDSCMPIVRLKPRGSIKRCPLLKDRKCSVHKAKPGVCAMFPIGRCVTVDPKSAKSANFKIGEIQYIFTNPGCGDNAETHTVREWLVNLVSLLKMSSLSCGIKRFSNSARFSVRRKRYAAITQWNLHGAQLSWSSIWNTTRVRIFSLNLKRTLKRSLIS